MQVLNKISWESGLASTVTSQQDCLILNGRITGPFIFPEHRAVKTLSVNLLASCRQSKSLKN